MSSTYDYLVSLLKKPVMLAAYPPASSSGVHDFTKPVKAQQDFVNKPTPPAPAMIDPALQQAYDYDAHKQDTADLGLLQAQQYETAKKRSQAAVLRDQKQTDTLMAAVHGLPYSGFSQADVDKLSNQIGDLMSTNGGEILNADGTTTIVDNTAKIKTLTDRRDAMQSSLDKVKADYMARPADLTPEEQQARRLRDSINTSSGVEKQQFQKQYDYYVNSEQYVNANWAHWVALAQPGRTLTTDEQQEAKDAARVLAAAADKHYWGKGGPENMSAEDIRQYNALTTLEGLLESKESGVSAAVIGGINAVPVDGINKLLAGSEAYRQYQENRLGDKNMADLSLKNSLAENAQQAHPGIYAGSNIAANIGLMALGGEGLKAAGIGSQALRDAALLGTQSGINSAIKQDWSKPWQAIGNTALDTGTGAITGAVASKLLEYLSKAIPKEWYNPGKTSTGRTWPETMDEVLDKPPETLTKEDPYLATNDLGGYTEGAGDVGKIIPEVKYTPSSGAILKANPNKTTTILGSFDKDMKNIVNEMGNVKSTDFGARKGGFNVLNVPDELYDPDTFWDLYNKPWLDEAIKRGDDIVLATKPDGNVLTRIDYSTGKEVLTGFGQEIDYLTKNGYVYDAMTNTMKLR